MPHSSSEHQRRWDDMTERHPDHPLPTRLSLVLFTSLTFPLSFSNILFYLSFPNLTWLSPHNDLKIPIIMLYYHQSINSSIQVLRYTSNTPHAILQTSLVSQNLSHFSFPEPCLEIMVGDITVLH